MVSTNTFTSSAGSANRTRTTTTPGVASPEHLAAVQRLVCFEARYDLDEATPGVVVVRVRYW
ncbi:uncharacterized protein L969DRAFT_20678 [Mixia osmundae IAM 14324]|uniref:uncharacterized protein n=1 Tax=Mixia osmundae (strain CBS 9802 / IAM 14324 / JCM 22182 / KY 12970) TaxID=764103 RepID=UPI0004A5541D|nr:uncharacterized protein L969DRAFT_20679 [Mixia osmundae IAM 14324]XP_014564645.1 uncharacterized protein L969DRAFT_20678 [Mixia osmundae IAM 14324]KEI36089.1 hypothetical protein L969DRAFT_20679 [Mixia osmundae IAM 14324]KEI36090.1 hypothetical protein L969DRAFT_20678 [Mixia osmundae IAM 14324]